MGVQDIAGGEELEISVGIVMMLDGDVTIGEKCCGTLCVFENVMDWSVVEKLEDEVSVDEFGDVRLAVNIGEVVVIFDEVLCLAIDEFIGLDNLIFLSPLVYILSLYAISGSNEQNSDISLIMQSLDR